MSDDWLPAQAPFELVRRGFAPDQVMRHLESLEYELRIATANREATIQRVSELTTQLSAAQAEADALRTQLDRNTLEPLSMASLSDRMQRWVRLAEEEAGEIRAQAEAEAAELRETTERETTELRRSTETELATRQAHLEAALKEHQDTRTQDLALLEEERQAFVDERSATRGRMADEVRSLVSQANDYAQQVRTEAKTRADALTEDAAAEAEATLSQARSQAETWLTDAKRAAQELDAGSRAEADRRVAEATAAAAELTAESSAAAERQAAEIAERHRTVEEDFEIAMAARRSDAMREHDERDRQSRGAAAQRVEEATAHARRLVDEAQAEAQRRVAGATDEATRRVAEADAAVLQLTELRRAITEQLAGLHAHLDQVRSLVGSAPAMVIPPPSEADRVTTQQFATQLENPAAATEPVATEPATSDADADEAVVTQ